MRISMPGLGSKSLVAFQAQLDFLLRSISQFSITLVGTTIRWGPQMPLLAHETQHVLDV